MRVTTITVAAVMVTTITIPAMAPPLSLGVSEGAIPIVTSGNPTRA